MPIFRTYIEANCGTFYQVLINYLVSLAKAGKYNLVTLKEKSSGAGYAGAGDEGWEGDRSIPIRLE